MLNRRGLLLGLLAAPAIIKTPGLLMPIKPIRVVDWQLYIKALEVPLRVLEGYENFTPPNWKLLVTLSSSEGI